jgi:hypothetical protein
MDDLIKRLRGFALVYRNTEAGLAASILAQESADALEAAAARNAESESHRNDLADKIVEQKTEIGALKARITALESERATLLHDVEIHAQEAERLDFMIEKEAGVWTNGWQWMVMQCAVEDPDILGVGKTPREAIDAALANQKQAG